MEGSRQYVQNAFRPNRSGGPNGCVGLMPPLMYHILRRASVRYLNQHIQETKPLAEFPSRNRFGDLVFLRAERLGHAVASTERLTNGTSAHWPACSKWSECRSSQPALRGHTEPRRCRRGRLFWCPLENSHGSSAIGLAVAGVHVRDDAFKTRSLHRRPPHRR